MVLPQSKRPKGLLIQGWHYGSLLQLSVSINFPLPPQDPAPGRVAQWTVSAVGRDLPMHRCSVVSSYLHGMPDREVSNPWGYPQFSSIYRWIFPWKSTIQRAWDTRMTMETSICVLSCYSFYRHHPIFERFLGGSIRTQVKKCTAVSDQSVNEQVHPDQFA